MEEEYKLDITKLFEALSRISAKLQSGPGDDALYEILSTLGLAVEVDRTYLFDFQSLENGNLLAGQRAEWVEVGQDRQIGNPELQNIDLAELGFSDWNEKMHKGIPVVGLIKDLPQPQREFLGEMQDIISIVFMPVFSNGKLVGAVGFDDCTSERVWSAVEIDALRIAASIVGVICY